MKKTPNKYLVGTGIYDGRIYVDGHDLYHYLLLSGDIELADIVMGWFMSHESYKQKYSQSQLKET